MSQSEAHPACLERNAAPGTKPRAAKQLSIITHILQFLTHLKSTFPALRCHTPELLKDICFKTNKLCFFEYLVDMQCKFIFYSFISRSRLKQIVTIPSFPGSSWQGYRVYFGQVGAIIVLLLCGGDKSTQDRDIRTAKKYWEEYRSRENA